MKIGFIGLGNMGNPMALNLVRAGFDVVVHDLDERRAERHLAAGAKWAASVRECAEHGQVVITSLPGPPQVESVVAGDDGLIAGLQAGSTWIDMTTNDLQLLKRLEEAVSAQGADLLDAPVTGAIDGAVAGKLTIFVGGDANVVARHDAVFAALGTAIHAGALGTGNVVKLVTNQLWFIHAAAIGEGLALGVKGGVDPLVLWGAIKSSVGNSFVAEHDVPSIFAGHYDPSFTLDLCRKDLGLIAQLGEFLQVPTPVTGVARDRFELARDQYGGEKGELHVAKLIEDAAGVSLRAEGDWPSRTHDDES